MLKLFLLFSARDWVLFFIALVFIVAGVWMALAVPEYLMEITDLVTNPHRDGTIGDVWVQGGYMFAFAIGGMITSIIVAWIGATISANHAARIRHTIFNRVGDFSTAEMKRFSVPSLITRSTNDVVQVRMFTAMAIQVLIQAPILAIWATMRILDTSWELSVVTFIAVGALLVILTVLIFLVMPRFNRIQKLTDQLNLVTRENISGLRVVRAYNAEEFEQKKFSDANTTLMRNNLFVNRAMAVFWPFLTLLMSAMSAAIYWVGSWVITTGRTDDPIGFFGHMMVFGQYSMMILFSFIMLIMVFVMFPRTLVSARRIMEVISTESTVMGGETVIEPANLAGGIVMRDVNFRYPGAEGNVLSDISLEIKPGETVAFIGGTGCGKSTLVGLVPRIYDATDGSVQIGGTCIGDMTLEQLNSIVGYVPQRAVIFKGTIKSNVAFGEGLNGAPTDDDVVVALKTAQAWEFVSELERGIESDVAQKGSNLSGGQKQRLSIARVIARRPKIFIFDDTFSALDYKTDRELRRALKEETSGATVLIVAQRIGTIKNADRIYVMDKGRIVGSGTHDELMKSNEVYQQIAQSQLSKEELEGGEARPLPAKKPKLPAEALRKGGKK